MFLWFWAYQQMEVIINFYSDNIYVKKIIAIEYVLSFFFLINYKTIASFW